MHTALTLPLAVAALLLAGCSQEGASTPGAPAAKAATQSPASLGQDAPKPAPADKPATAEKPAPDEKPAAQEAAQETKVDTKKLLDPKKLDEKAPATYKARFETNEGSFVIEVTREWSPLGADRVYNLVKNGFYDNVRFFRVLDGFMAQFGVNGDPQVSAAWMGATIKDDPVTQSNTRGMLTFAKSSAPNSRSTQLFINFADNANLDGMGFSPVGKVIEGMEIVDKLYSGYGEGAPRGKGPDQGRLQAGGNAYLAQSFPELDYIVKATIVE